MAIVTGTHDISTLLAARFQSAAEFGLSTIEQVLQADIDAHNAIVQDMVSDLCEVTTDRQRIYGTSASGEMMEVDEFGRAPTQKNATGATVGFPLKSFQFNLGWTEKFLRTATPADLATMVQSAEKAHLRAIQREIKRAVFLSSNYTHRDHLVDNIDLSVKRFVNADSANIPDSPNGETFDGSTHTHYDARVGGSVAASDVTNIVNDVVEHGHGGAVKLVISRTDETTFRTLMGTAGQYVDPRLIYRVSDTPGATLDVSRLDNRAIGILGAAEVWVKPWGIANYAFAYDSSGSNKPLAFRQRSQSALQGLRVAAENSSYPLYARFMEAEYGIGVWTRTNGAVLYFGNTTYADPTIN